MTHRQRVLDALHFKETDRVPRDLGAMASTCISAFVYAPLRAALGLPPAPTIIYDEGQMLALPHVDVLDALGIDVISVGGDHTNAFYEDIWHPYDFGGRLQGMVRDASIYSVMDNGWIRKKSGSVMPTGSTVFDTPGAEKTDALSGELNLPDVAAMKKRVKELSITDEQITTTVTRLRRAREVSDRALSYTGLSSGFGFYGGMVNGCMLLKLEPELMHEYHGLIVDAWTKRAQYILPEIKDYVDVLLVASDDMGTQNASFINPAMADEFYFDYYKPVNAFVHAAAPNVHTFLHSCGAIYELLEGVIGAGFDIVNPVQWNAGRHSFKKWKDVARGRITLWGGGVDTQTTLPRGSAIQVRAQVNEVVDYMRKDGGFVFCAIHNILAEVAPEKVVAMYEEAGK